MRLQMGRPVAGQRKAAKAMRLRPGTAPSDPGETTPCRYQHRAYRCPMVAKACTRDSFLDGQYESQGGPMLMKSRAYRCDKGHLFQVKWTEEKGS